MTDVLTLAIRRARYGKNTPRQEPPRVKLSASILNGPPIKVVQHFVAAVYGVNVADLIGQRRSHEFILPRHVAMHICSELLQATSTEIGRRFNNRDHSTVLHAIGKIGEMRRLDPKFGLEVEKLIDDLRAVKPRRIMREQQQYTIEEKLAEIIRELEHRREVYPFRVTVKVMRQEEADRRIAILEAILADYQFEDWQAKELKDGADT